MSVRLFKGTLDGSFKPSEWLQLVGEELSLTWQLTTSGGPTVVVFYLEFTDDPSKKGSDLIVSREVDEQDTGKGVVSMAKVIRQFNENNATTGLSDGTSTLSTQFTRQAPYVRVQVSVTSGTAALVLTASSGALVVR